MNIYTDVTKQKADMKTAIDAFLACDGMIEVLPSKKKPTTQLPSTSPVGDWPTPLIAGEVIPCSGIAQGREPVGI